MENPAPRAVAHRGDPYQHRENTLPSLRSAMVKGADAVEVDVRLTSDGVPVLLHDTTLNRLWGLDQPISGTHSEEVRRLGVPTLGEALRILKAAADDRFDHLAPGRASGRVGASSARRANFGVAPWATSGGAGASGPHATQPVPPGGHPDRCRLMVDLMDQASAHAAVADVCASAVRDRVYYCGHATAMRAVRRADPDAEIALTWRRTLPPHPQLLDDLRPRWLNLPFGLVSRGLVRQVHGQGLLVGVWTVDMRFTMARLLRSGVDAVTTNRIGVLRGVLG